MAKPTGASAQTSHEYELKAIFLYNFASFVEWPPEATADPSDPFVVGVLGQDPFGTILDRVILGEEAAGRPIVIRRFRHPEEVARCHLLFISESEGRRLRRVLSMLADRPILTVGDMPGFASQGGMIELPVREGRVALIINPEATQRAGLQISSKLLEVAHAVHPARSDP